MPKTNHYKNSHGQEIDFTLYVRTRPNLRGSLDEMFMYRGKSILETMFDKCAVDQNVTEFDMYYPERWANILELRAIPERMLVCFPNLKKVTITTHSVYIIQCTHSKNILVDRDAEKYPENSYGDLNVRYCDPPNGMKGLYAITPDKIEKVN